MRQPKDQKRWLWVTPEIEDLLRGRSGAFFPDVQAELLTGRYAAGELMTVSRRITDAKPDIEQIVGVKEVWALCPRKPKPGWRILGRFFDADMFVALHPWDKAKLAGQYPRASAEVIATWQKTFGLRAPHTGQDVSDYMSGVVKDVDQPI